MKIITLLDSSNPIISKQILFDMKKVALLIFAFSLAAILTNCSSDPEKQRILEKARQKASGAAAAEKDEVLTKAQVYFGALPELASNDANPITPEKVALGQTLYYDKRLSKDGNISCNSCHNLESHGVDNLPTSPGDLGKNGDRNSPTVLNAAFHTSQFWDGRAKDVEEQAGMPIMNPVEMNIPSKEFLVERLKGIAIYGELFKAAYPKSEDPITYDNLQNAIGAFERTLVTPGRIDDYLKGDVSAITQQEKKGLVAFIETGCITCHMGPQFGGQLNQKFGLFGNYWEFTGSDKIDDGLATQTGKDGDKYIFKTPGLRNVTKTQPYFHDGSIADLSEAVKIMAKLQLNKELTEEQVNDITAFLKTLEGEVPENARKIPEVLALN